MSDTRWSARVHPPWDAQTWRRQARTAVRAAIAPEAIDWLDGDSTALLPARALDEAEPVLSAPRVPQALLTLADAVACHRDPGRFGLLYRLLWRLAHGESGLLSTPTDADVRDAFALAQEVRRDAHKMKAFVRFRELPGQADHFIAWFEPQHRIVDRVAPFFARRFAGMRWSILTPYRSVHWDGEELRFADGAQPGDAPADDASEDLWRTYYASIFNPARLNPRMMRQEMPVRYWTHLPEAHLLPELTRTAGARVQAMAEREAQATRRRIPDRLPAPPVAPAAPDRDASLAALRQAAADCRACPLWEAATRTVFGEGPEDARILLLGEQPGDMEDLSGRPFVGPAGRLLDRALDECGLDRSAMYLTNAVKHFRFERRGKVRLHRNPEPSHVQACRTWLAGEIERVQPDLIVCLGATAALAVFGGGFRLMEQRGVWHTLHDGTRAMATVHPAWVLRQPSGRAREDEYCHFVQDLARLRQA